jgi:hypothetical protein
VLPVPDPFFRASSAYLRFVFRAAARPDFAEFRQECALTNRPKKGFFLDKDGFLGQLSASLNFGVRASVVKIRFPRACRGGSERAAPKGHVPEESIVFLTGSESQAMSFGKDLGTYAGGFIGGAVGTTVDCVGAALALIPGFGQVFVLGVGGAALLGYLGSKVGGTLATGIAEKPGRPKAAALEKSGEEGTHLLEVLKQGRSVIVVRMEFREVAEAASGVLDKLALGEQAATASSSQTATRQAGDVTKLREAVATLVATGSKKVILNLKEVNYVDSSGMRERVRSQWPFASKVAS